MTTKTPIALALAGLALLAGCAEDDAQVLGPVTVPANEIFDHYVALGNSITAGYQSGGINDSTQLLSYPKLVADAAGATFELPLLTRPGCPPPLAAPLSTERVPPALPGGANCALRAPTTVAPQNLAVPGAAIASTSDLEASASALTTFILGGRTPIQRMLEQDPTLVTAWIGNNDVLGAALTGNLLGLTPLESFQADLDALVTAISQTPAGAGDAVALLGVVDPRVIPALQPGLFAYVAAQNPATAAVLGKPVSNTCHPAAPTSRNLVSLQVLSAPLDSIYCSPDRPFVVTAEEAAQISARADAFNQAIAQAASANGWIFIDPNQLLLPSLGDPNALRKCQGYAALGAAPTLEQIQAATLATCPLPGVGFGSLISYDGFHPSTAAHRLVAGAVIEALNAKFDLDIETPGA